MSGYSGDPPLSFSKVNPQSDDSVPSVSSGVPVESKTLDDKDYVVRRSIDRLGVNEVQRRLSANDGTDVTQVNSEDPSKSLPFKDIIEESALQCPPPPSEKDRLSESTGSPERPLSRKGGVDKEDQCEDVDKLPLQCTEENPQKDLLLDNEDSQITYLQYFIETPRTALTETSGSLVTEVDVAEESQSGDGNLRQTGDLDTARKARERMYELLPLTKDLQCPTQCSEPNPEKDQEVRNNDEDVPRAGTGPFIPTDGDLKISSPSTELKPKLDEQV